MAATRRHALLGFLVVGIAACTPMPTTPSPTIAPTATATVVPSSSPTGRYPVLIVRVEDVDVLHWYVTSSADPSQRRRLAAPPGDVELGPAATDGTVPLTVGSSLLLAALRGDDLTIERTIDLGRLGIAASTPACLGPGPRVAVADHEALALTVVAADGPAVPVTAPDALGECAWLDDGRLLLDREGDRLAVADAGTGTVHVVSGGSGRHPSTGGGLIALVDRSGHTAVVVLDGDLGGPDGTVLGSPRFTIDPAPDELISRAQLSPDGGWLAVEAILAPEGDALRRLRLYEIASGVPVSKVEIPLGPGEQVVILPTR